MQCISKVLIISGTAVSILYYFLITSPSIHLMYVNHNIDSHFHKPWNLHIMLNLLIYGYRMTFAIVLKFVIPAYFFLNICMFLPSSLYFQSRGAKESPTYLHSCIWQMFWMIVQVCEAKCLKELVLLQHKRNWWYCSIYLCGGIWQHIEFKMFYWYVYYREKGQICPCTIFEVAQL